ncbi:tonalli [Anaeramoeba flamelloides]|uniref:Tonalli n=1 Tax=Anaeramoeba flamelloides TaxID=1746091 RepID=A0ABQ8X458_9EUKA|nr:tonalli [Anaeramoeba flamelloides]
MFQRTIKTTNHQEENWNRTTVTKLLLQKPFLTNNEEQRKRNVDFLTTKEMIFKKIFLEYFTLQTQKGLIKENDFLNHEENQKLCYQYLFEDQLSLSLTKKILFGDQKYVKPQSAPLIGPLTIEEPFYQKRLTKKKMEQIKQNCLDNDMIFGIRLFDTSSNKEIFSWPSNLVVCLGNKQIYPKENQNNNYDECNNYSDIDNEQNFGIDTETDHGIECEQMDFESEEEQKEFQFEEDGEGESIVEEISLCGNRSKSNFATQFGKQKESTEFEQNTDVNLPHLFPIDLSDLPQLAKKRKYFLTVKGWQNNSNLVVVLQNMKIINFDHYFQELIPTIFNNKKESFSKISDIIFRSNQSFYNVKQDVCSLKCPISMDFMELPARGKCCKHLQCFDLKSYLKLALNYGNWNCPCCSKPISIEDLSIDGYILSILKQHQKKSEYVTIYSNSRWEPLNTSNENKNQNQEIYIID